MDGLPRLRMLYCRSTALPSRLLQSKRVDRPPLLLPLDAPRTAAERTFRAARHFQA
jgi:hypothetical protein